MAGWLWFAIIILAVMVAALLIKIYLLKKSAKEIREAFADKLVTETNTLIDLSGRDRQMRMLADCINAELRKLRSERRRYKQGDRELKETITNITHDIRTPLTAICGYLDLLQEEEKSEAAARYLDVIQNRAEVLKQLTEELFCYSIAAASEADGENGNSDCEELVLNHVLEESILAYYAALKGCGITPEIFMPETKVKRILNKEALARIFGNVLSNAIKYSDGDLRITLSETGEVLFSNHASAMDEVQAGQLFDRFYTVETGARSTGLGLSIAKVLTGRMNGVITAQYHGGVLDISILFPESSGPDLL